MSTPLNIDDDLAKLPPDEREAWHLDLTLFGTAMLRVSADGSVRYVASGPGRWVIVPREGPLSEYDAPEMDRHVKEWLR